MIHYCSQQFFLLDPEPHYGNSEGMQRDDAPPDGLRRDLPPVPHATLRCTCARCIAARQAEVRRRIEERRREEQRDASAAVLELRPVLFSIRKASQPGTRAAIVARYGRGR